MIVFNITKNEIIINIIMISFLLLLTSSLFPNESNALTISYSFLIYIVLCFRTWYKKVATRVSLTIGIICIILIYLSGDINKISSANIILQYIDIFWLIFGMGLIKIVFRSLRIYSIFDRILKDKKSIVVNIIVSIIAAILTWPVSLAAISLMIDSLKENLGSINKLTAIITRSVSATMVLMPTTIGAASVFSVMPDINMLQSSIIGIPIFIFCIISNSKRTLTVNNAKKNDDLPVDSKRLFSILILFWIILIFFLYLLKINSIQSIAFTGILIFLVDRFLYEDKKILIEIRETILNISSEILLLCMCSLILATLKVFLNDHPINISNMFGTISTFQVYVTIIFILPLFSLLGVHPLLIFSIAWPLLSKFLLKDIIDYQIWICFFISAQLLSPISINTLFASNSSGLSLSQCSYKMHYKYILAFSIFSLFYLNILSIFYRH